jgi:hypothetical protein
LLFFDLEEKYFLFFFASPKTRCIFDELKITHEQNDKESLNPDERP